MAANERAASWYSGRRVLVTGGLGFIGMNLVLRLADEGADVTVLDHFVPADVADFLAPLRRRVHVAMADIRDADKVERLVRDQAVIFNLAGKSGAADSNAAPLADLDINCRGHLTLLDVCRRVNPSVSIIFPSSRLVYGQPQTLPVAETHPVFPTSIYGVHKLTVEHYHLVYGRLYGMKATVLRIANPYGPMQARDLRPYGIANRFIQIAADDGAISVFGDGGQLRDYLYIDDLAAAFLAAGEREIARGKIYNIGSPVGTTLLELAEAAVASAGSGRIQKVPWPEAFRAVETGDYVSDVSLARRELGWEPKISLSEGIQRTIDLYRQTPEEV